MIVSQLKYKEIEAKGALTDDDVIATIRKQLKELAEAKEQFLTAKRQDLADANSTQIQILKAYLPSEIPDHELESLIRQFIASNEPAFKSNPKTLTGKIVGALKSKAAPDRIVKAYNLQCARV
jgi:uncharacterized protein YqeY